MCIKQHSVSEERDQEVKYPTLIFENFHAYLFHRLEKSKEQEDKQSEEDRIREETEAKERSVQEFERIQMGLEAKVGAGKQIVGRENGKIVVEEELFEGKRGEKRKFELDEDELLRIAREDRTKARKALDDEKVCKVPS